MLETGLRIRIIQTMHMHDLLEMCSVVQRAENEPPRAKNGNIFRDVNISIFYDDECKFIYDCKPLSKSCFFPNFGTFQTFSERTQGEMTIINLRLCGHHFLIGAKRRSKSKVHKV